MPNPLISIGSAANDGTGEVGYRAWLQKINRLPVPDSMINAGSGDYTGTTEQKINAALAAAILAGTKYVWLPQSLLPYNASLVTNLTAFGAIGGRLIREGGNPVVYDVRAYGAAGNFDLVLNPNGQDDTVSIQAAITAAFGGNPAAAGLAGIVYLPCGSYKVTAPLTVTNATRIVGALDGAALDRDYPYCRLQGIGAIAVIDLGSHDNCYLAGFN